jgi:type VI protein secretion system component VasK
MLARLRLWHDLAVDPRTPLSDDVRRRLEQVHHRWQVLLHTVLTQPALRQRLATLPWYLVAGPPGAGASTLLAHCGLELDRLGGAQVAPDDDGLALWLGERALFVEAPGRLLVDAGTHHDWRALLRLMQRTRGRRPLDGVLLVKPLAEQVRRSASDAAGEATLVRDRLCTVAQMMRAVVPTYVVVTKADLFGGFKEFVADLGAEERQRVLGMTLSWPGERDPVQAVGLAGERLLDRLRDRRLRALAGTDNETAQRKLMQFPAQLRAALPYLTDFLAIALRPPADAQPTLRGVYFTSVPPARRPAATPVAPEHQPSLFFDIPGAAGPGAQRAPAGPALAQRPPALFVHDLFSAVVLADDGLATPTTTALTHARRWRAACLVVTPLLVGSLAAWSGWSTWRGLRLIDDLAQAQSAVDAALPSTGGDRTAALIALDQLGTTLHAALAHHGRRLDRAGEAAAQRYLRALRPLLLDPCLSAVQGELQALGRGDGAATRTKDGLAELLRAYQMLGGLVKPQAEVISRALLSERRWFLAVDPPGGTCEFRIEALARRQLDHCVGTLLPHGLLRVTIDQHLVAALHQELGDRLILDQAYDDLIHRLEPRFAQVPADTLLGDPARSPLGAETAVSLLYTQEAWDGTVAHAIDALADRLVSELAEMKLPHDRATIIGRLRQRYVDDQQARWLAVIASMRAAQVRDFRDTPTQLERLAGDDSPLPRFLTTTLSHLALTVAGTSSRGKPDSSWIRACQNLLSALRSDVLDYQQAMAFAKRTSDVDRLRVLIGRFNAASTRVGELIATVEPAATRSAIQTGFDQLLRSLVAGIDRACAEDLDRLWSEQVHLAFDTHLARRFPFARDAADDVPMEEFEAFFHPGGTLWSVLTQIETLRDLTVLGRPVAVLDGDYARLLRTAQGIRTLFFAGSSPTLNLRFTYRMQQREHVRDLRVQFGMVVNSLYERPDARYQVQIAHGGPYGARVSAQMVGGEWKHREQQGDWGFLRLLRAGAPKPGANGDLLCTWEHEATIDGREVTLKATVVVEAGPLVEAVAGDLLTGWTLPRRILRIEAGR